MPTEKQKKAMTIFETRLTLLLGLFKSHHSKDLTTDLDDLKED